jgi:hypothetical protein
MARSKQLDRTWRAGLGADADGVVGVGHVDEAVALYVRLVPAGIDAGGLTASGAVALERAAAVPDGALGAADDGLLNLTINCRVHMQTKDVQCRLN